MGVIDSSHEPIASRVSLSHRSFVMARRTAPRLCCVQPRKSAHRDQDGSAMRPLLLPNRLGYFAIAALCAVACTSPRSTAAPAPSVTNADATAPSAAVPPLLTPTPLTQEPNPLRSPRSTCCSGPRTKLPSRRTSRTLRASLVALSRRRLACGVPRRRSRSPKTARSSSVRERGLRRAPADCSVLSPVTFR